MTNNRTLKLRLLSQLIGVGVFSFGSLALAADVVKSDNSDNLNLTTSWSGGSVPGNADVAVWNAAVTAANTVLLGTDLSWQGIRIADPAGAVTINAGNTLTLGSAGIDLSAATQNLTLANAIDLASAQTWSVGSGRTLTSSGIISGAFELSKTGAGTLVLNGANTYSGGTVLSGGTLNFNGDAALGAVPGSPTTNLTVSASSTLNTTTNIALNANRNMAIGSNVTLTVNNTGNLTINGQISNTGTPNGTASIRKAGTGVLELSGANSFVAGTKIDFTGTGNANLGTIRLLSSNALGSNALTINNTVTNNGGGGTGNAVVELVGGITVPSTVSMRISGRTTAANRAALRNVSGDNTWAGELSAAATGGGYPIDVAAGKLTLAGPLTNTVGNSTNRQFQFYGAGDVLITGLMANNGANLVSFNYSGTGTLTIDNPLNTYTGGSNIVSGTVRIANVGSFGGTSIIISGPGTLVADYNTNLQTTALTRIASTSTGTFALAADNSEALDFNASANLATVSLGAVGTVNYTGTLTPNSTTYRLGGGGGTLSLPNNNALTGANDVSYFGTGKTGTVMIPAGTTYDYTGITTIANGTVTIGALGNAGVASALGSSTNDAANLLLGNGGTLSYTGATTTSDRRLTLNAGVGTIEVVNAGTSLSIGPTTGAGTLAKSGPGTLVLQGTSTATGTTTVTGGTLALGGDNALGSGTLTLGGGTNVGTLDLGAFNQTVGGLLVPVNSTSQNTVTIGVGKTLTVNGTAGYSQGIAAQNQRTNVTFNGGGSLVVDNSAANFVVGLDNTNQNGTASAATLNMSALASFTANVNEFRTSFGSLIGTTTTLSNTANAITANVFSVGNSNNNNSQLATVIFGEGTNTINADTIHLGLSKGSATVRFASQAAGSPGSLTIGGKTTAKANFVIGSNNGSATAATPAALLDLRGHVANVTAGSVILGQVNQTSGGTYSGTLNFDAGTFTVDTLNVAPKTNTGSGKATGIINIGGGTFTVNPSGTFTLGSQTGGGSSEATLNITGGTVNSNASILDGGGNADSTLTLDGGTLDLFNNTIGNTVPVNNVNLRSGTLRNVAQINNGAAVSKTNAGTLIYEGTNAYTGATAVAAGKLLVNGTLPNTASVMVDSAATLGGSGTISGATTISSGAFLSPGNSPGNLTFTSGLTLNAGSNFVWELFSETTSGPGVNYDRVTVGGTFDIVTGTNLNFAFGGSTAGPVNNLFWNSNQVWQKIVDSTGGTIDPLDTGLFVIDNSAWSSIGSFSTVASAGNTGVDLVWTPVNPVPEPGILLSGGLALLGLAALRLRRRRAAKLMAPTA